MSMALDEDAPGRVAEFRLYAEESLKSIRLAAERFPALVGHAATADGALAVEATAFGRVLHVSIPSRPKEAALAPRTIWRAVVEESRRLRFATILENRRKTDKWSAVQRIASDALAGVPEAAQEAYKLIGVDPGAAGMELHPEPWAVDGENWPLGHPRLAAPARSSIARELKAWTAAVPPRPVEPEGFSASENEDLDWSEEFDQPAAEALAGDLEAEKAVVAAIARPVTAILVCATGEHCKATVQHGRALAIDLDASLPNLVGPLGDLVLWTIGAAAQAHQDHWYENIADQLPRLDELDPELPERFKTFRPIAYGDETDERRAQRQAFQKTLILETRERNQNR